MYVVEFTRRGTPHTHVAMSGTVSDAAYVIDDWLRLMPECASNAQDARRIDGKAGWATYLGKHNSKASQAFVQLPVPWTGGRLWGIKGVDLDPEYRYWVPCEEQDEREALISALCGHKARNMWDGTLFDETGAMRRAMP